MSLLTEVWRRNATLAALALLMLALTVPLAVGAVLDPRTLGGAPVWLKPAKFALSLGVYALTLAWFCGYARPAFLKSGWARGATAVVVATSLFELGYIAWRASRAEASHFNVDSLAGVVLFQLMGVGAVLLTAASLVFAAGVWRGDRPIGAAYRLSVVAGLILGFLLGTTAGGFLGANGGHWIGGDLTDATGLALMGWSTTGGDLRISHFVGLHAIQAIPLFGLLTSRLDRRLGVALVLAFCVAWSGLFIWLLTEALAGRPPGGF